MRTNGSHCSDRVDNYVDVTDVYWNRPCRQCAMCCFKSCLEKGLIGTNGLLGKCVLRVHVAFACKLMHTHINLAWLHEK